MTGIYKITSPTGKVYIGQSRVVENRWRRHREANRKSKLHSSLRKYGWRSHIFEIACELPFDINQDELNRIEQVYMDAYKDCGVELLNIKEAGSLGLFTDESKLKMSLAHKGKEPWNKGKKGSQVPWNKGLSICRNTYEYLYKDEVIEIFNLKEYCRLNNLEYTTMIHLYKGTSNYSNRNYYKGYKRIEL